MEEIQLTFCELDPETWKRFLPSTSKMPEPVVFVDVTPYWTAALDLVNAWSKYQAASKKMDAYLNGEAFIMGPIIKKYWGNLDGLERSIKRRLETVKMMLAAFNVEAASLGCESVDLDWIQENLQDATEYKKVRKSIRKRMKARGICSFQELV